MIRVDVPGAPPLLLEYLVLDFNGTLARDGVLSEGVAEALRALSEKIEIHVVTADTFGRAAGELEGLPCRLQLLPAGGQAEAKRAYLHGLGADRAAAIGNGRNDARMLGEAALGICVLGPEGAAGETLLAADAAVASPLDALGLLIDPLRLVATLRD
ncbi:MAG: ATPase P [Candidatus Eisenbacteria bacterium]|nr:ATPase P [Candidatus Eisenbacteria bacterium]